MIRYRGYVRKKREKRWEECGEQGTRRKQCEADNSVRQRQRRGRSVECYSAAVWAGRGLCLCVLAAVGLTGRNITTETTPVHAGGTTLWRCSPFLPKGFPSCLPSLAESLIWNDWIGDNRAEKVMFPSIQLSYITHPLKESSEGSIQRLSPGHDTVCVCLGVFGRLVQIGK